MPAGRTVVPTHSISLPFNGCLMPASYLHLHSAADMFLAQRGKPAAFAAARQHLTPHSAAALQVVYSALTCSCRHNAAACQHEVQPYCCGVFYCNHLPLTCATPQLAIQHLMLTQTAQAVLPAVTLRPLDGPAGGARTSGAGEACVAIRVKAHLADGDSVLCISIYSEDGLHSAYCTRLAIQRSPFRAGDWCWMPTHNWQPECAALLYSCNSSIHAKCIPHAAGRLRPALPGAAEQQRGPGAGQKQNAAAL